MEWVNRTRSDGVGRELGREQPPSAHLLRSFYFLLLLEAHAAFRECARRFVHLHFRIRLAPTNTSVRCSVCTLQSTNLVKVALLCYTGTNGQLCSLEEKSLGQRPRGLTPPISPQVA